MDLDIQHRRRGGRPGRLRRFLSLAVGPLGSATVALMIGPFTPLEAAFLLWWAAMLLPEIFGR